jgi:hypothetical protein
MKKLYAATVAVAVLALCSVALAAVSVKGTYKETVHSSALGGQLNGTWTLKLTKSKYTASVGGHAVVHGKYTIKGNKISLTDSSGRGKCPGTGVYKVKKTGTSLKFTKVSDPNPACVGRATVLTAGTWTKAS